MLELGSAHLGMGRHCAKVSFFVLLFSELVVGVFEVLVLPSWYYPGRGVVTNLYLRRAPVPL